MKPLIKLFIIISIFFFNIRDVFSENLKEITPRPINNMSNSILEQITPKFKNKKLKEINSTIIIPKNFKENEIIIVPQIFSSLREFNNNKKKYNVDINITIKNNSLYDYSYLNNSLIIQTDDIKKYGIDENFDFFYDYKGFDNRKILKNYSYNLTLNDPVKSLTKEKLNKIIKNNSLNKYYLDYYNKKYNANNLQLSDFDIDIIDEIFSGKKLNKKIDNKELVELSYNYYYNYDLTINNKSIAYYMKEKNNIDNFKVDSKRKYKLNTITVASSKLYSYPVDVYMEFRLSKV